MITDPSTPVHPHPSEPLTLSTLESLSPHERCVAWIMAIHYLPIGKRELAGAVSFFARSPEFRVKLKVTGLPVAAQIKQVLESIETLSKLGIVVQESTMWMCSWSAHPIICAELRASPEILARVRAAVKTTTPSSQFQSMYVLEEGLRRWESLLDNTFVAGQQKGEWLKLSSHNRLIERIFSTGQLTQRWYGTAIEENFATLPSGTVISILDNIIRHAIREKVPMRCWVELLERFIRTHKNFSQTERSIAAWCFLVAGYPHLIDEAIGGLDEKALGEVPEYPSRLDLLPFEVLATLYFFYGNYENAARLFEIPQKKSRVVFGPKHFSVDEFGLLHLLSLFRHNTPKSLKTLHRLVGYGLQGSLLGDTLYALGRHAEALPSIRSLNPLINAGMSSKGERPSSLLLRWCEALPLFLEAREPKHESLIPELVQLYHDAIYRENPLIADWSARSLADLGYQDKDGTIKELGYLGRHGFCYPLDTGTIPAIWEAQCKQLAALSSGTSRKRRNANRRVAWVIFENLYSEQMIVPFEQRLSDTNEWQICEPFERGIPPELLSEHDRRALVSAGMYNQTILAGTGAANLIGHPHLYLKTTKGYIPTTLHRSSPRLFISRSKQEGFLVLLYPSVPSDFQNRNYILDFSTPSRIGVCETLPSLEKIASIVGPKGIDIPEEGRFHLEHIIKTLSPLIPIEHDISSCAEPSSSLIHPNIPLVAQLYPLEPTGIGLRFISRPDTVYGLEYIPGEGPPFINWHEEGKPTTLRRSLADETEQVNRIIAHCDAATEGALSAVDKLGPEIGDPDLCIRDERPYSWSVLDPQKALQVLAALAAIPHECSMEWPVGQSIKLLGSITPRDFSVVVRKKGELFEVTGSVRINEALVEGFRELVSRVDGSNAPFIKVDDKTFISISSQLKAQLRRLKSLNASLDNGEISLHSLTSDALEEFLSAQPTVDIDAAWKKHVSKMTELRAIEPALPAGITATLRPYQEMGVRWLLRMSTMGAGCCLADDMGLGKTLQALAAMLHRAEDGPSLIVAPTSVCSNWIAEAGRFAPQLKTSVLPSSTESRKSHIAALGPNDVLIISYGLLQRGEVTNLLAERHWAQVILDEAQAIKNSATARTRSIREIPASWRLALSGTPIENRLEELWSIFHFLNPGLLGTTRWFQKRFLEPIEKHNNTDAAESLRAITSPFILRRLKNEVLTDLPPKETITIHVELYEPEAALYEALRREIASDLEKMVDQTQLTKENRLHVFAAMTRLRRLACNAALGTPPKQLPSAKLAACMEIIDELRANGHRALVFSQFVGHLEIVKEALAKRDIPHLYLDGSTPAASRAERVASFQSGVGDIFLISLKAGGVGLNLTAADYVIHLDPWWNPAVLDQATDRAHRIGQQKPVTVYQLVSQGTIEEKIIERHDKKRALADSILDGADTSAQFNISELLDMIAEGNVIAGRGVVEAAMNGTESAEDYDETVSGQEGFAAL